MPLAYLYFHHMDTGWGILMTLGMVAFWALVIAGVVWLIRSGSAKSTPGETPRETLDRRLASGELSIQEYERRRSAMDAAPRQPTSPAGTPPAASA
jgi:putative membrane protein